MRKYYAADLSEKNIGQEVEIAGWIDRRRDHGGVAFFDLRDTSGIIQLVINDEKIVHELRNEFVVHVIGKVRKRPEDSVNENLKTGQIEIVADNVEILNSSKTIPFQLAWGLSDKKDEQSDEIRFKYRYLDLRTKESNEIIKFRSKITRAARDTLYEYNFNEIETPTLVRSTPEGARDFIVPARLVPGHWYALAQSPQLYKQLLMIGGLDRYFQFARCYRDEDFRADRQPEFTQLDLEMSFVETDEVIKPIEQVLKNVWKCAGYDIELPIKRMSYADAMKYYGSDRPDLRFENRLVELTDYFKNTPFRVFQAPYVGAILMKDGASLPRRQFDAWQEWARSRGAKGLAYVVIKEDGELAGPVAKNISEEERAGLKQATGAENGDAIFFAAGNKLQSQTLLGAARVEIAKRQGILKDDEFAFVWIEDFPLYKKKDSNDDDVYIGSSNYGAMHHPFVLPSKEWRENFDENPDEALSDAYDIVCNGNEIGGGSQRIYTRDMQVRSLKVLGLSEEEIEDKFGFILSAFDYGAPPHAGIALGWDRICSLLMKTDTIRDVIAFPKLGGGYDPMTNAPSKISKEQRRDAGVDYKENEKKKESK